MSIQTRITQELTGISNIDALLSGFKWAGPVTYSFPISLSQYYDYLVGSEPYTNFFPLTVEEQGEVAWVFSQIMSYTNLSVSLDASGAGDIRMGHSSTPNPAYTYYPGTGLGGDVWFDNLTYHGFTTAQVGSYSWLTHIHEIGHALGLKHSFEIDPAAPTQVVMPLNQDALEYTVMSYRSFEGASQGYTNEKYSFPQTFMMYDIAALQSMYGADFTSHAGSDVYSWNPLTGATYDNGVAMITPLNTNRVFMTIWDGGGHDTFDMSNYTTGVNIDLRPGAYSITSHDQLAVVKTDAHGDILAHGNIFNALEYQGNPASLIEDAIGGSGDDILRGNAADNALKGNGGHDTFVFDQHTGHDTIVDFQKGTDKIDLSNIPTIHGFGDLHITGDVIDLGATDSITVNGLGNYALDSSDFIYAPLPPPTITSWDIDGNAGFMYRLYQAAFDRTPDLVGLTVNLHLLNSGLTHEQMSAAFVNSTEFGYIHGYNSTDIQFITALYEDVLHRAPEAAGLDNWVHALASGVSRESVLIGFSESPENHTLVDPGLHVTGIALDPLLI